jgi:hypothetical protein
MTKLSIKKQKKCLYEKGKKFGKIDSRFDLKTNITFSYFYKKNVFNSFFKWSFQKGLRNRPVFYINKHDSYNYYFITLNSCGD